MSSEAQFQILHFLREKRGEFVSGEEISRSIGVSRAAVWKRVRLLRRLGYSIEAVTSRGYRLLASADTLIPGEIREGLKTRVIGQKIIYFEETDSTNMRAQELGRSGAVEGTVIVSDCQTAGRGRLGRSWASPPGVNLYTSVLLRPPILPQESTQLTFLSAVATARALEEFCSVESRVKWPNDILLGGKKVAGLLNEMSAETEGVHFVVLGIGVNLNMMEADFPADLRHPATSILLETGGRVSRSGFARCLYRHLDDLYQLFLEKGFPPILRAWEAFSDLSGRRVSVDLQGETFQGAVIGLDSDGALLLHREGRGTARILAGDVRILDEPHPKGHS